ncbi:MAG: hypothetical protein GBAus27B_000135 [Mycoplasmataceae bacterium]|nr:MAG: hypothetical protein GBAus27B_000135 [Mycoplasmataceae bacterium]
MPKNTNSPTQAPTPNFDTVDGRYLNRTNRTVHFATKVTPEFNRNIRRLAHEQQCMMTEVLEKFMSAYFELEEIKKEQSQASKIVKAKTTKSLINKKSKKTIKKETKPKTNLEHYDQSKSDK